MPDKSAPFDQSVKQQLIEELEIIVLAICRIQQRPAPDGPMRAAIVKAELAQLTATGRVNANGLDQATFDRVTLAIRNWYER